MRARVLAIGGYPRCPWAIATVLALTSCTTLLGIGGDYTTTTTDSSAGDDGAVDDAGDAAADVVSESPNFDVAPLDAASCGAGRVCVPAPPSGWSGPVG